MTKTPEWRRQGYLPNGPGCCICPKCKATISTNALARAAHEEKHVRDAKAAKREKFNEDMENALKAKFPGMNIKVI